jgi:hypothetical protein
MTTGIIILIMFIVWSGFGAYGFIIGGESLEKIKPNKRLIALLVYGPFVIFVYFMIKVSTMFEKFGKWLEQ